MSTRTAGRPGASRAVCLILATLAGCALAGCQETELTATPTPNALTGQNPSDVKYYRSDEPVRLGIQRFNEGNFGLSQHYFQDAVEKTPRDVTAWIGLAASYDRLGRFDLADHAYTAAINLDGKTASILNNDGYSYMLRGNLKRASAMLDAALKLDPSNPTTINNQKLLNSSSQFVERGPDGEPCGSVPCGHQ
jgi:Flp pilus assembly protein TadD